MFKKLSPLLIGFGLIAFSGIARADNFDYQIANILLLQDRGIQKDMGVDEAQRGRLNDAAAWFQGEQNKQLAAYKASIKKNPKAKPDSAKMASTQTDFKRRVMAQLSAGQIRRLREVTLQVAGYSALADKNVAARVGISEPQRTAIQAQISSFTKKASVLRTQADAIKKKAAAPVIKSFGGAQPKDANQAQQWQSQIDNAISKAKPQLDPLASKLKVAMSALDASVEKIVTPAQLAAFKSLEGTPYKEA